MAVAVVVAGAGVGLAGPAAAEAPSGTYTASFSNGAGSTLDYTWTFTPCGPDCTRMDQGAIGTVVELRLQGNTRSGSGQNREGRTCTAAFDAASLSGDASLGCGGATFPVRLTKAG